MMPFVSLLLLSFDPNTISANPTKSNPTITVNMPTHICFFITRPRKATDRRAVNMITAPEIKENELCTVIKKLIYVFFCKNKDTSRKLLNL